MSILDDLIKLLDSVESFNADQSPNIIKFDVRLTEDLVDKISNLYAADLLSPTYTSNHQTINIEEVSQDVGNEIELEIFRNNNYLKIAENFDSLLKYKKAGYERPSKFYILSEKIFSERDTETPKLKSYIDISTFIQLLIQNSDHENKESEVVKSVVFLHKNRIEIDLKYDSEVINLPLDGLGIVRELFGNDEHIEQKKSIFKELISTFLSPIKNSNDRLKYLLENFSEFSKEFNENYHLFVSDFSFDNVRCEYQESKRKYFLEINNILAAVQTKMLGIPVALAVAAFKLNSLITFEDFFASLLILLAVLCYWYMMRVLISNQKHSLESLKDEFTFQMTRFNKQYPNQYSVIKIIKESLNERFVKQQSNLTAFKRINGAMFIIVLFIFLYNINWSGIFDWFICLLTNALFTMIKLLTLQL